MAPNSTSATVALKEQANKASESKDKEDDVITKASADDDKKNEEYKMEIVWINVLKLGFLHFSGLYACHLVLWNVKWTTVIVLVISAFFAGLGVTAGAHRLWSHRSYKAKIPLRILLMIFNCVACQNDIYEWSRDHRVHHKFSETDADPHNVHRGFFFAHVGWLMVKKHPEVLRQGKKIDVSDLWADPVVRFQRKFYLPLVIFFTFLVPTVLPNWCYGETYWNSFFVCAMLRYCITLNFTWLVNSAAHLWGNKPYDQCLSARENYMVTLGALGEGYHNYHHTFPHDYATSEFGWTINMTTIFIDTMAFLGQVTNRRTIPLSVVRNRMKRTGEGSGHSHQH